MKLDDKWTWDFWLTRDNGLWHIFFLQANKSLLKQELRHWNVSVGHATSSDLQEWQQLGTCFQPSATPSWDDKTTWTGSVVQGDDGLWHLFYTGTSEKENGMKQRIGHATSTDLHGWERVGNGLCLDIDTQWYEEYTPGHWHDRAMRDPWVMRDPHSDDWLMFFTARVPGTTEPNEGGAIGLARSSDLKNWTTEAPIWQGDFGQLEVPQVMHVQGKWYCLFCTADEHWSEGYTARSPTDPVSGSHYLMADDIRGPWRMASGPFLDGGIPCKRYAGKLVEADDGLKFLGFLHDTPEGEFIGELSDPIPVSIDSDGLLHLDSD
ncbi:glycoside hydrolase family 68 protein [Leucothrix pacifica]|uniref:Levansucrase n=1 Tax=Leucothrix pacifica TaxID=1247513 RepID=A0A317CEB9_9GAMM|nr:glycoside hydrolase family 68 protein [Leucothrix pacifica]PWQ96908.1 levansucrase [Leucothrix pacifica]